MREQTGQPEGGGAGDGGEGILSRLSHSATRLLGRPVEAAPIADSPAERDADLPPCLAILAIESAADRDGAQAHRFARALHASGAGVILACGDASPPALMPDLLRGLRAANPDLAAHACASEGASPGAFTLWRDALARFSLPRARTTQVILASTRLRGPFGSLEGLLARLDFTAADLWGLAESWEGRFHLPAGLLAVGTRGLAAPAWAEFWAALPATAARRATERQLEVALTQNLLDAGLTPAAVWPYATLLERAGEAYVALRAAPRLDDGGRRRLSHLTRVRRMQANRTPMAPLHFFWEELLELGCPFVADALLTRNPHGIVTARDGATRIDALMRGLPPATPDPA